MCGANNRQLGLTDPLLQVPGHKIHFTATGSGANVSFEALGGWDVSTMNPNLGKSDILAKLGAFVRRCQTKNERLEARVWYKKWQKTKARWLICSCPD